MRRRACERLVASGEGTGNNASECGAAACRFIAAWFADACSEAARASSASESLRESARHVAIGCKAVAGPLDGRARTRALLIKQEYCECASDSLTLEEGERGETRQRQGAGAG